MAEDTMLHDAIEAIRRGDKARAKDLLTRLIAADQNEASYWVWMSATVETKKERIYALKTALRVDPENASAQRGLILMGALPPDETVEPFPINHPRLWEEQLIAKPDVDPNKPTGFKGFVHNPIIRLAGILVIGAGVIGLATFWFINQRNASRIIINTHTPGPSPTFTLTPTAMNAKAQGTPTFAGPTPLWALLDVPYTPTPLYVNTPRSIEARDYYNAVKKAYEDGDWDNVIFSMGQIAAIETESADPHFYIGEAHRFKGENAEAFDAYNLAIERNADFGPAYLGRARVLPYINERADILDDLDKAIDKSPDFAEAYLERARYYIGKNKLDDALADLESAQEYAPESALVAVELAQVYFAQEEYEDALAAAKRAYELDITVLDTYLLLGRIYEVNGQIEDAVGVLQTYLLYEEGNTEAMVLLSGAHYAAKEYDLAIELADNALELDHKLGNAYLYRGLSYLALEDGEQATIDLDLALRYFPKSFEASLGLAQANAQQEFYGNCYLQVESTRPLAENDEEMALIYYWRATCHEGRDDIRAATADWESLLELPFSVAISPLRAEAREHLADIYTPTPTSTAGPTPTGTPTPTETPED